MAYSMDYWDSIDIGIPGLNHSQGFFRRRHSLHEKGVEFRSNQRTHHPTNLNVPAATKNPDSKDYRPSATAKNDPSKQKKTSNKENEPLNRPAAEPKNRAILAVSVIQKSQAKPTAGTNVKYQNAKNEPKHGLKKAISVSTSSVNASSNNTHDKKVLTKSSSYQKISTSDKLYEQAEIQKKRKEMLVKKIKAEEEKELKFKFHAKPVPKFVKTAPSLQQQELLKLEDKKKTLIKQQSMPNLATDNVKKPPYAAPLVPSCGDPERIKMMHEHKKRLMDKYKPENIHFKAKPATVLQKPVFQPKHNFKTITDAKPKPFKLVLTQRMIQRSNFDKQLEQTMAIKEKQKEMLQRQRDLEDRKLLRQKTEFKARPNPFPFLN